MKLEQLLFKNCKNRIVITEQRYVCSIYVIVLRQLKENKTAARNTEIETPFFPYRQLS